MSKFLTQPLSPFIITQKHGEDKACVSNDNKIVVTKEQSATCPSGFRSLYGNMLGHQGLDLFAKRWQPIYAAATGKVIVVSTEPAAGLGLEILTLAGGTYFKHRYWHLIALDVHQGDEVKCGDFIGYADSTGYSSGDHLHFDLKECDEFGNTLNHDNGYLGAVDPEPYMSEIFALDAKMIENTLDGVREKLAILVDSVSDFLRKR